MKDKLKKMFRNLPVLYSFLGFLRNMLISYPKWMLFKIAKNWVILNRINVRIIPWIWKLTGVNVKGRFFVSYDVYYDVNNAHMITIEEDVLISPKVVLFCHKRDLSQHYAGDKINKLPFMLDKVYLKKGCAIGTGSIILPGVTIGEGAIIGAGSVVTKSVPNWTIAAGNPAKVLKEIPKKNTLNAEI